MKGFKTLDLEEDAEFKALIRMASEICDTPVALITLMDKDTQWLRVRHGTDVKAMPMGATFCEHTLQMDDLMVVNDATKDERFIDNPIVAGAPNIRFYAGSPLKTIEGQSIGSLCVLDVKPQDLNKHQLLMLKMLSSQVMKLMEFRMECRDAGAKQKRRGAAKGNFKKGRNYRSLIF